MNESDRISGAGYLRLVLLGAVIGIPGGARLRDQPRLRLPRGPVFPAIFLGVALATLAVIWLDVSPTSAVAAGTAAGTAAMTRLLLSSMLFGALLVGLQGPMRSPQLCSLPPRPGSRWQPWTGASLRRALPRRNR
jgi:hypothetical protein